MPSTLTPISPSFDLAMTPSIDGSYLILLAGAGPFVLSDRETAAARGAGWLGSVFSVAGGGVVLDGTLPATLPVTL